jgi:hypothetical protein
MFALMEGLSCDYLADRGQSETLFRLQNLIIRIGDGTPIAWAFLGSFCL